VTRFWPNLVTTRSAHKGALERLYEIDGLRFVAATLVLFYHFTFFGFAADQLSPVQFDGLSAWSRYGGLGVNLFFITSGFVILMTAQRCTPAQFVVARVVRLYPAYWVCCTATYLGLLALPHPQFNVSFGQYMANLTMVSPLAGIDFLDGVYWSLFVELKFYLLVFLLLALGLLRHTRVFLGVWLAISLLEQHHLAETHATSFLFLTDWSGYFIAGAMCYCVRQLRRWDWYSVGVVSLSCLMAVQRALVAAAEESRQLGTSTDPAIVSGLVVGFFVVFALVASDLTARFRSPRLIALGGLTYPLYLLHQRLGLTVLDHAGRHTNKYVLLTVLIAGTFAAATTVHRCVERPLAGRLRSLLESMLTRMTRPVVLPANEAGPAADRGGSAIDGK
jgi:peptidoglycan/LPS O-acetylase OafA/YrhL